MPLAELEQGSQVAARLFTLRCTAFLPLLSDLGELRSVYRSLFEVIGKGRYLA